MFGRLSRESALCETGRVSNQMCEQLLPSCAGKQPIIKKTPYIYIYIYICIYVFIYLFIVMCVYIHTYLFIYIYIYIVHIMSW